MQGASPTTRTPAPPERVVALAAPAASPSAFAFSTLLDGKAGPLGPVRADPLDGQHRARPGRRPGMLQESVDRIAQLTGTTWVYVGPSSDTPTSAYLPTRRRTSTRRCCSLDRRCGSDLLAGQPRDVLGMTRTAWFGIKRSDGTKIAPSALLPSPSTGPTRCRCAVAAPGRRSCCTSSDTSWVWPTSRTAAS
jgi:hypothetical protein